MIDQIRAQNVALIKDVTLEFSPGLTVLTGETGAGKTALLGALKLMVGERADASVVREGQDQLLVEGRFYPDDDKSDEPDGHVVVRRVTSDGRGRVEIDGHMASVRELASGLGTTVDLVGQYAHQQLLDVASHAQMLDSYLGERGQSVLAAYQEALAQARSAEAELKRVRELANSSGEALAEATFVLSRIDEVAPQPHEDEELARELPRAEHAEALMNAAYAARELLVGEDGVSDKLSEAILELSQAAEIDSALAAYSETINTALIDLDDVSSQLRAYLDTVEYDPDMLESMQARMAQLQGLMRTYGPTLDEVFRRRAQAQERIDAAGDNSEQLADAQAAYEVAEKNLASAADALDKARTSAAPKLAAEVSAQMARLEMGSAEIEVEVERLERAKWTTAGPSRVELMYKPGAGMEARPLRKIASGGEVSRVMLACKVVLGDKDHVGTLVFDEVDAGVGGATAKALAAVLEDLARTHQVIVVTHLAQVAVVATKHYLVHKTAGDVPETKIDELVGQERVAEIARMLSGDTDTTSLAHAQSMLDQQHA